MVTTLLPDTPFDPARTVAMICGPEIMMRFTAMRSSTGVDPLCIRVSLERNMQCGVGLCGHCQLGPLLVCRDGPVVSYGGSDELFPPAPAMTTAPPNQTPPSADMRPTVAVWKFASCDGCQFEPARL